MNKGKEGSLQIEVLDFSILLSGTVLASVFIYSLDFIALVTSRLSIIWDIWGRPDEGLSVSSSV